MIAACVWRASCVSALFRQALDVLEVDALRVWSWRKVPRLHFSLAIACEATTMLQYIHQIHVIHAVLPNASPRTVFTVPLKEDHVGPT
jgi:hypothetical protein